MQIERFQGGSVDGLNTHESAYYQRAFELSKSFAPAVGEVIDPFARNCNWGSITNDLDEKTNAQYNMDCADFLEYLDDSIARIVLFDPPFSRSQSERYEVGDTNLYASGNGRIKRCHMAIERILKPGGIMVKLGYNSSRPTKNMDLIHLMVVNFGGNRNDVIVSFWKKNTSTLREYMR